MQLYLNTAKYMCREETYGISSYHQFSDHPPMNIRKAEVAS